MERLFKVKGTGGPLYLQNFFLANGTDFYNEDYTEVLMDSDKGIEAFTFFIELHTSTKSFLLVRQRWDTMST